uniref:Uncharacterized protein n=1 Tax=viral metagenome TaxID=1070528 RepID=A0A6C0IE68_9ZZZZ
MSTVFFNTLEDTIRKTLAMLQPRPVHHQGGQGKSPRISVRYRASVIVYPRLFIQGLDFGWICNSFLICRP